MKPTTEELKDLLEKVTPGEWGVKTGVYVDKDSCIVFSNDGDIDRHIADCGVPKTNENESNAKLIKLAPSLAREVIGWREQHDEMVAAKDRAMDLASEALQLTAELSQFREAKLELLNIIAELLLYAQGGPSEPEAWRNWAVTNKVEMINRASAAIARWTKITT